MRSGKQPVRFGRDCENAQRIDPIRNGGMLRTLAAIASARPLRVDRLSRRKRLYVMGRRSNRVRLSFACVCLLFAEPGAASPPATAGATSEAKIRISVSVARRLGLRALDPLNGAIGGSRSLCVWSSLPLRGYTLTLDPVTHSITRAAARRIAAAPGPERTLLLPGDTVEGVARPSAGACGRSSDEHRLLVPRLPGGEPILLILAPQ